MPSLTMWHREEGSGTFASSRISHRKDLVSMNLSCSELSAPWYTPCVPGTEAAPKEAQVCAGEEGEQRGQDGARDGKRPTASPTEGSCAVSFS